MEMRPLGRTGCTVSAVGLGVMTFGAQTDETDAFAQLDMAIEAGVNLFDVAENYPAPTGPDTQGRSEEILGRWVTSRGVRDRVVIATKVTGPNGLEYIRGQDRHLDRRNIVEAVEGSLKRLGTDHIDLYQTHWPERPISTTVRPRFRLFPDSDKLVPIEETLAALGSLVDAGKVRHLGVANESPWGVMEYLRVAEQNHLPRIASIQNGYSLLSRGFEITLAEVASREDVGLIGYSPLAGGLLTGKYSHGALARRGTRMAEFPNSEQRYGGDRAQSATQSYVDIATTHGLEPAAMALAFVRDRPFVASVLVAASRSEQLGRNLKSLDVVLDRDILKAIDAVHDADPNPVWR